MMSFAKYSNVSFLSGGAMECDAMYTFTGKYNKGDYQLFMNIARTKKIIWRENNTPAMVSLFHNSTDSLYFLE